MSKPNLTQGEGGAHKKGPSGSKFEQSSYGGAVKRGPSGSKFDQHPNVRTSSSGSHLAPQPGLTTGKHAPQRGGHSRDGYDHTERTGPSGSKNTQHPNNRKK